MKTYKKPKSVNKSDISNPLPTLIGVAAGAAVGAAVKNAVSKMVGDNHHLKSSHLPAVKQIAFCG